VIIMEDHEVPRSNSLNDNDDDSFSLKGSSSDSDSDSNNSQRDIVRCQMNGSQLLHIVANIEELIHHRFGARPMRNSILTGQAYLAELLSINTQEQRFQEVFRMSRKVSYKLCNILEASGYLRSTKHIANEQVAMFIWTVSHNRSSREVQERFQHGAGSVSE